MNTQKAMQEARKFIYPSSEFFIVIVETLNKMMVSAGLVQSLKTGASAAAKAMFMKIQLFANM